MKRMIRILLISLVLSLVVPAYANADTNPPGYKIVKLTNKNVKKYFSLKVSKNWLGDYNVWLYSKLRKKGYFLVGGLFYIKGSYRYKIKPLFENHVKTGTKRFNFRHYEKSYYHDLEYYVYSYEDDFLKYCKISNIRLTKAKGYAIFATPSNIGGSFTNDFSADPYRDIYLYYDLPEQYKDYSEVEYSYSSDFDYSFLRHNELFNLF